MSTTDVTLQEIVDSLTGFDEIAIEKETGYSIAVLFDQRQTQSLRALVALQKSREEGVKYADAYKQAMGMRMADVNAFFAEDNEVMPDEPVTESGKDDSQQN